MKVSVVVSICDNRKAMMARSLYTWACQTLSKKEFELVVVDDAQRDEIKDLCHHFHKNYGLQFQYIRIDSSKCDVPITTFLPILTNNVGIRKSKGDVIVITGPETLQGLDNLKVAFSMINRQQCAYGLCYKSNSIFVSELDKNWDELKDRHISGLIRMDGAAVSCLTRPPHPPAYWYIMAVAKRYVEKIGGVDETFATGYCAEDDDFANRMRMSGVTPVFEHRIIGIHQDHSAQDAKDKTHSTRATLEGQKLRQRNINLMKKNLRQGKIVANTNHRWGDQKVITEHNMWENV
jgi:glycosyltransferase involved in cell wall biosynthesis